MTSSVFDPLQALRVLNDSRVAFVVIGGYAADLLGAPLMTNDLDVCPEQSGDNFERLATALGRLGARQRAAAVDEDLSSVVDMRTLTDGDALSFLTDAGSLGVCATPWGTCGFQDLSARAVTMQLADDLRVRVVDLADLMRMKRASVRIRDEIHLEALAALREMLDETNGTEAT